jgi:hypothetical protein
METKPARSTTREEWLEQAIERLRPTFTAADVPLPERVRVSIGWPGGRAPKRAIGQCWSPEAATDGLAQVFVSPVIDDPSRALDVLVHELCHAADRCQHGHRAPFPRYARSVGLVGPWTETTAGPGLAALLAGIVEDLGPFPHAALRDARTTEPKKQGTRMLKCACPACGYTVRTTAKWLEVGLPICPVDELPMDAG